MEKELKDALADKDALIGMYCQGFLDGYIQKSGKMCNREKLWKKLRFDVQRIFESKFSKPLQKEMLK